MEEVKLRVVVEKGELKSLKSDVIALKSDMKQTSQTWADGKFVKSVDDVNIALGKTAKVITTIKDGSVSVTKTVTENFDAQRRAAEKAAQERQKAENAIATAAEKSAKKQVETEKKIQTQIDAQRKQAAKNYEKYLKEGEAQTKSFTAEQEKAANKTNELYNNIVKFARWYVIGNIIGGIRRAFNDALDTMKEVDSQLVVIRKVTGASEDRLKAIEEQAYKTASALGVTADAYLESVAAFSRAGYGEQAEALAELATKTQLVGDVDAETANQFLLSVDAAYKYNGSIAELSKVLDGANEIDNKYATSIQKIAEGMGIVAPVAEQAHVGVNELAAAIGTITAVTQRSGTEAARAFRALVLNIIGDTKTEIDEGVTWTTGEIAGLKDVIKQFAPEAYNTAQALGQVINPMEAIGGLAKSMQEGLLTEQQLMEMVSDIGGKLRTSQLLALIQNWDMYQSMLGDYANAVGSADREVENALNSWERKTAILSNKWTEFVSHLVDTDTIKWALDGVIKLVDWLDTSSARTAISVAALATAMFSASKAATALMGKEAAKNVVAFLQLVRDGSIGLESVFSGILGFLTGPVGIIAALVTAIALAEHFVGTKKWREYEAALDDVNKKQEALTSYKTELEELASRTDALTEAEKRRKQVLEEIVAAQEEELKAAKEQEYQAWQNIYGTGAKSYAGGGEGVGGGIGTGAMQYVTRDVAQLDEYNAKLETLKKNLDDGQVSSAQYAKQLNELYNQFKEEVSVLREMQDADFAVSDAQRELIRLFGELENELGITASETAAASAEARNHVNAMLEEASQSGATEKALYDLVAAQIAAETTTMTFSQQIAALQALAQQAGITAGALMSLQALQNANVSKYQIDGYKRTHPGATDEQARQALLGDAWKSATANSPGASYSYTPSGGGYAPAVTTPRGNGGSGSSNEQKSAVEAEKKRMQAQRDKEIAAIDEQIELLKAQKEKQDDANKLAKLQADLQKAELQLEKDRNERTIRFYNKATGQWEWIADNTKIIKDEQDVEDKRKAIQDFKDEQAYKDQLALLEEQKKGLKQYWDDAIAALDNLLTTFTTELSNLNTTVNVSVNGNKIGSTVAPTGTGTTTPPTLKPSGGGGSDTSAREDKDWDYYSMKSTSSPDAAKVKALQKFLNFFGFGLSVDGIYGPKTEAAVATMQRRAGVPGTGVYNAATRIKINEYLKNSGQSRSAPAAVYDLGGILRGMGGIKATNADELILPPQLASKMLSPIASKVFHDRLGELSYLYGAGQIGNLSVAGNTDNRIGSQHNGNVYSFGGVTISEQQAKTMSVYEFARKSKDLGMYAWQS